MSTATFDAYDFVDQISPRSLLTIAGSDADTLATPRTRSRRPRKPKELFVIDRASHVDLCVKAEYVDQAVAKMVLLFTEHLAAS